MKKIFITLIVLLCASLCFGCESETDEDYLSQLSFSEAPTTVIISLMDDVETDAPQDEQALYDEADELYMNSNNEKSIETIEKFLAAYPDSVLADDAEYLLAINYRNQNQFEKAANQCAKLIINYPNSSSVCSAYYEIGYLYECELNKESEALKYYLECAKTMRLKDERKIAKVTRAIEELSTIEVKLAEPSGSAQETVTKLAYSYDDIFENLKNNDSEIEAIYSYEYEKYDIKWATEGNAYGQVKTICYIDKDTDDLLSVMFACRDNPSGSAMELIVLYYEETLSLLGLDNDSIDTIADTIMLKYFTENTMESDPVNGIKCRVSNKDDMFTLTIFPKDVNIDVSALPVKIERDNDFLSNQQQRDVIKDSLENHDYDTILELADEYINKQNPASSDTVFKIKEYAQTNSTLIKKCVIEYDQVEKTNYIYYKDVEEISRDLNFVPYIEGHSAIIRLGFITSNWLFFESYQIATDAKDNIDGWISFNNIVHDVLSASAVLEYVDVNYSRFSDEEIEQIVSCSQPILRFENEDGKYIDHTITKKEKEALVTIGQLRDNYAAISNIIYTWEND